LPRQRLEHSQQVLFFRRLALDSRTRNLAICAVPNFSGRLGRATAIHGAYLKAEGRKPGVPDILCFNSGREWSLQGAPELRNGLALEMKHGKNKTTPLQEWWLQELRLCGWRVNVVYGAEEAWNVLLDYLGVGE